MTSLPSRLLIELPQWARDYAVAAPAATDDAGRMRFVVEAAQRNVEERTGGPFAAAVFDMESGGLVSLGVNLVANAGISILHAEILALALAQQHLGVYDLGAPGHGAHALFSSAEPCAMCLGAIPWSGVRLLVAGAARQDVEAAGFDEGQRADDWADGLRRRGVAVSLGLERARAAAVISAYAERGGPIYNPRRVEPD